ncbi:MAG: PAS domain S-box protein, partial [Chloroflexota bacterium]
MKHDKQGRLFNIITQVCGLLAAGLGIIALLGWIFGLPLLSSFGTNLIPMAPSTASLFALLGVTVFLCSYWPESLFVRISGLGISILGAVFALSLLVLSSWGIYLEAEYLGLPISGSLNDVPVGHMSPVTATLFLLLSLSFLFSLLPASRRLWAWTALGVAGSGILASYVLILAYSIGLPLLYGGGIIPPALPTSLAFLALGSGLLTRAWTQVRPPEKAAGALSARVPYTLLMIFVLLTLSFATIGYIYYHNYEQRHRTEVEHQLSAIAELKVSGLEDWRAERLGDAEVMRQNAAFAALVGSYLENPDEQNVEEQLQSWLDILQTAYLYERISLLDTRGILRLSSPENFGPPAGHVIEEIPAALESGQVVFLDFHVHADDTVHLSLLVPIFASQDLNQPLGILVLEINPDTYLYPYLAQWPAPTETAETLLVRRDGEEALFLNPLRFQPDAALKLRIPLENTDVLAVKAILGEIGIVEGTDYRGEPVIGDVRPVPGSPWYLVARMDTAEVYIPLRERLWQTVAFFGALIAASGAGLALAWRQQRVRYYRERYDATEALRESEERYRILADYTTDWVYWRGQDGQFVYVSPSCEKITGYSPNEFTKNAGLLSKIIHPEDRELFENHHRSVEGSAESVGVDFRVITRAGETRWLNHLCQPVYDEAGKYRGRRAANRDITERRQAEEALRQSEQKFTLLFEKAAFSVVLSRLPEGVFVDVNEAFEKTFGYTKQEAVGKTSLELGINPDDEGRARITAMLQAQGSVRDVELMLRTKSGEARAFLVNIDLIDIG